MMALRMTSCLIVCPAHTARRQRPAHAAPVSSNDDDAETSGDEDRDSSRTL